MIYENLQDLLRHSSSSRRHFLSLPVSTQMKLHKLNGIIHSAQDLRRCEYSVKKLSRQVELGGWTDEQ